MVEGWAIVGWKGRLFGGDDDAVGDVHAGGGAADVPLRMDPSRMQCWPSLRMPVSKGLPPALGGADATHLDAIHKAGIVGARQAMGRVPASKRNGEV